MPELLKLFYSAVPLKKGFSMRPPCSIA